MSKLNNKATKKQIFIEIKWIQTDTIKAILFQFLPLSHQKAR